MIDNTTPLWQVHYSFHSKYRPEEYLDLCFMHMFIIKSKYLINI